jgi:uncharacterized damage-inducible protein DinB
VDAKDVLIEAYDRLPGLVRDAVEGLEAEQLGWAPAPGANTIGWLVWHLTRVQDHHVSELLADEQVWETGDWAGRFGLKPEPQNTGYGHSARQIPLVRPESAELLVSYHDAVHARTVGFLRGLADADLDRVVDDRWDPPVTLGVRLVSVVDDDAQHVGQAAYLRGLLERG